MAENQVVLQHVTKRFTTRTMGTVTAVDDFNLEIKEGECFSFLGPSGCGKSTLLNLICGLLHAESGTILMNGKPLNKDSARIGYMLQKDHLLEWRSIYRNVLLGLEIQGELTKDIFPM